MYSCRGLYNQMIYVLPGQDIVVAVTGDMRSGGTDDAIADYILASITEYDPGTEPAGQSNGVPGYPVEAFAAGLIMVILIGVQARTVRPKLHNL